MKPILLATALSFLVLLGVCLAKYGGGTNIPQPRDPTADYVLEIHNMTAIEKYLKGRGISYTKSPLSSYPKGDSFWMVNKGIPQSSYWHLSFNSPVVKHEGEDSYRTYSLLFDKQGNRLQVATQNKRIGGLDF